MHMSYQEFDAWLVEQAKGLPVLRGDRGAQAQAKDIGTQSAANTAQLAANAQGIFGQLTPFATKEIFNPQGFGTAYPGMVAQTGAEGSGIAASAEQKAAQKAAATGNLAGLTGAQEAAVQQASQGTAANLQDLAVQNQLLKNQQQQAGASTLAGIYGQNLSGQLQSQGQQIQDVNALTEAGRSGWLQNTMGILGSLGQLGGGVGGAMGGYGKLTAA